MSKNERIEISKGFGGQREKAINTERTIHNPDQADIGQYISRVNAAKIIEIAEAQEHSPVFDGAKIVVDYVVTGYRRISFLVIEDQ